MTEEQRVGPPWEKNANADAMISYIHLNKEYMLVLWPLDLDSVESKLQNPHEHLMLCCKKQRKRQESKEWKDCI